MATVTSADHDLLDRLRDILARGSQAEALAALAEHREGTQQPVDCPRATRLELPFRICPDCDGTFPCELTRAGHD